MTMNSKKIEDLLKQNPRTVEEIEDWGAKLRKLGHSFLIPLTGRAIKKIKKNGYIYMLVSADEGRYEQGVEEPNFMGNRGFALRSITKIN